MLFRHRMSPGLLSHALVLVSMRWVRDTANKHHRYINLENVAQEKHHMKRMNNPCKHKVGKCPEKILQITHVVSRLHSSSLHPSPWSPIPTTSCTTQYTTQHTTQNILKRPSSATLWSTVCEHSSVEPPKRTLDRSLGSRHEHTGLKCSQTG